MSFVQSWLTRYATRHPSPVLDRRYAELVSNVSGRVVELGCARGFLFRYYPESVDQLLALEPRADYRANAREIAERGGEVGLYALAQSFETALGGFPTLAGTPVLP
jgi:hypothetical protein